MIHLIEIPFKLKKTKMSKIENALIWLYANTWGLQGQHVIDEEDLWNFGGEDLEAAIMGIAFPRKETSDRIRDLNNLILGKFENVDEFCKWARTIHGNVIETMPAHIESKVIKFSNSNAIANDRITGEPSIIAFRATASKIGERENKTFVISKPGMFVSASIRNISYPIFILFLS